MQNVGERRRIGRKTGKPFLSLLSSSSFQTPFSWISPNLFANFAIDCEFFLYQVHTDMADIPTSVRSLFFFEVSITSASFSIFDFESHRSVLGMFSFISDSDPIDDLKDLSLHSNGGPEPIKPNPLVVCFGEMLIDFVPSISGVSLAEAPDFKKAPGGAPANVAVGIARLGGSSAFIGKVGDDEFGHMLADILKKNKVDNSGMRFDQNARTALAFVTLKSDGEREFMFFRNPSADMLLRESELDLNLIKQASIFHYGSISLIEEPCKSTHLVAMAIAKKSGSILSYDVNLRLPLWPSEDAARQGIMSIWDQADIIKVSEDEITFLTGGDDPYDDDVVLNKLFHPNLKLLLVSEGPDGCRYYTKEFKGRVPSVKVKPVDTTGAGDAFVGGILSNLALDTNLYKDEAKLREALVFANACGALTVTKKGAIPAMPTRDEVHEILKNE
ncbi:unnamed protein product [Lactuca saligna]|uniref:fructokinase n=1 Tax=Lactuca saligna TaxID=75948 RepID=A0AA36A0N2_LACSI|nr:unnamed protein product [Lactuca saligna]